MKRLIIEFEEEVELKDINQIISDMSIDTNLVKRVEIDNKVESIFFQRDVFDEGLRDGKESDIIKDPVVMEKLKKESVEVTDTEHEKIKKELENNPKLKAHFYRDCKLRTGGRVIMTKKQKEVTCKECLHRMGKKLILHMEDPNKEGYYLCIQAVGKGIKKKMTKQWKKVTCKNCLARRK